MGVLKTAVLGLGPSIQSFEPMGFDTVIGVNDIYRHYPADAVVCLDYPRVFDPVRLKYITNCNPLKFYSQIVAWDTRPDFEKITLIPGYPDKSLNLDIPGYWKSFCSPFVAVQIAFKIYGSEEIHLFGVDMTNHPHLDRTICAKIKIHFRNLESALAQHGAKMIVHGNGILTA